MTRLYAIIRSLLEHQWLPCGLALAAVVLMLPALSVGLVWDDLIQRPNQFKPAALPPLIRETGFVANNSGELGTVMQRQFAYLPDQKSVAQAKNYGIAPWWVSDDLRLALWRPVTAFTHWLDYRLYPDSLALMHVQNIAWFAVAVFLAATLYRRIEAVASDRLPADKRFGLGPCIAGLAACLWLLDKNTYIPVAYVANRGFFISLVFGFLCLHAHVHWRTGKSRAWMGISAGCLLLSLLADEGGASTLAFLMAYALVLEPGRWLARLASLLPAALVMVAWRVVYVASGFGVRHLIGYIDPGYAPVAFLERLVPRANALLGGQLTGLPPEFLLAFNPTWQVIWGLIFAGFSLICAIAFLPWLRRDAAARFWAAVMLLALVPAATVIPISKNLGFVAFGAFGLVATFFIGLAAPAQRSLVPRWLRAPAWALALVLVIAHVVLPAACRIGLALGSPSFPRKAALASDHDPSWDIGDRDIVVINDPAGLSIIVPFYRAYRNEPLPRSTHILVPGSTVIEVEPAGRFHARAQSQRFRFVWLPRPWPGAFVLCLQSCERSVLRPARLQSRGPHNDQIVCGRSARGQPKRAAGFHGLSLWPAPGVQFPCLAVLRLAPRGPRKICAPSDRPNRRNCRPPCKPPAPGAVSFGQVVQVLVNGFLIPSCGQSRADELLSRLRLRLGAVSWFLFGARVCDAQRLGLHRDVLRLIEPRSNPGMRPSGRFFCSMTGKHQFCPLGRPVPPNQPLGASVAQITPHPGLGGASTLCYTGLEMNP